MNQRVRAPLAIAAAVTALALAWCSIRVTRSDALVASEPQTALRLDGANPRALLRIAKQQLRDGDNDAAMATARRVLSIAPAQGDAFAVIARGAIARGDDNASSLLKIAVRRAPRDSQVRGQSALVALKAGDLIGAMRQVDAMLNLGASAPRLYAGMAVQAQDPRFAEALATILSGNPGWRNSFMKYLGAKGAPHAVDQVNAALNRRGNLLPVESGRWLDRMFQDGRWGEAYAYWTGTLEPVPPSLPLAYNGNFEKAPTSIGFDWHEVRVPGVSSELEPGNDTSSGNAAHFRFLGLRAAGGDMRLPLLLAPGGYRLSMRARADYLRSDQGLRWKIRCADGQEIAATEPLDGNFRWQPVQVDFQVPATQCPGQWMALENPAIAGSARQVSGDLWTDAIRITPLARP